MSNARKTYSEAECILLLSQVNRVCPLCNEPLFYRKSGKDLKKYQLAHIYPLNPTTVEKTLLENEKRLSENVNSVDNIIPLCEICHGKFDKPRTITEYIKLYSIKKELIARNTQESMWKTYSIENEISEIINAIYNDPILESDLEIEFKTKEVNEKLNESMSQPTNLKIKRNVQDYYFFISRKFKDLDNVYGDFSEIISLQIKTFYLKQKNMAFDQQTIFDNLVRWVHIKTKPKTNDAAEILVSFFIQNCEVF